MSTARKLCAVVENGWPTDCYESGGGIRVVRFDKGKLNETRDRHGAGP
jgi:hypothetical protein